MPPPRRILMTSDTVGGVWTYALDLARALTLRGVTVGLATMGPPLSREQRDDARGIPLVELFESAFKLEWMPDAWDDVRRAGEWLLALEARLQPDLVHLNGYAHAALPWRAPVLAVGHSCVLSWWRAVKGCEAPASWDCYREAVWRGLAASKLVVAPSRAMLDALVENYPGAIREARVIPNGRDAALFQPRAKSPYVLAAGRLWDEGKNIAALERAAARLPWPVYLAGERRSDARPARGVRFLGPLRPLELAHHYSRAAIYALPARYEPFGLSVLEAAMSGCALVLGDIPSLRENWRNAAVFVSPDDSRALTQALVRLISNTGLRRRLGARARMRARRFTHHRMAEAYLSAYREICAGSETATCAS
ncbi:MAG TPA: glycosyltransferase family 4 protein [Bryobacteraceae bacterium]|nr:glycosyltransferase family 4 protein [Bryobacteraceae bacterium]HPU70323.1 glycosyltransferase family 4 protein [Bryobacteraceae bacterium]